MIDNNKDKPNYGYLRRDEFPESMETDWKRVKAFIAFFAAVIFILGSALALALFKITI